MSKINVEKFAAGTLENSFGVPAFAVNMLAQILPASAMSELASRGIDIQAILSANKLSTPYSSSFEVTEEGVQKTIIISVTADG
ncbi:MULTISPECIES: hypothetical protein [Pectobacterium]|uniref:hypothetical protein n=1 Tax=Pectobacterium TaxID=122277 RepID=UPI00188876FF|nr:hypothetical protein [Pectobacterium carotovorum]